MTDPDAPIRIVDGGDGEGLVRRLIEHGQSDLPTDEQLGRVAAGLGPLLGPAPGAGGSPGATGGAGALGKIVATVLVVGAIGGGAFYALRDQPHAPEPPSRTPATVEPAPKAPPAAQPESEATLPSATPDAEEPNRNPVPTPRVGPSAEPKEPRPDEARLLGAAQQALKTDPERALALTRRHAAEFPDGALVQEREVIQIEALSRLGRKSDAKEKAAGFEHKFPGSAHRRKIEDATGSKR